MQDTKFNFDAAPSRFGTSCYKYDFMREITGRGDLLPLWVADMDFLMPEETKNELISLAGRGLFGYSGTKPEDYDPLIGWYKARHGWEIKSEWILQLPSVVCAISQAVLAFTEPGDSVIIQQPVYHPFYNSAALNGRRVVDSPLALKDGVWGFDIEDFERKIIENNVKLFILCSPHNPVGRVWSERELRLLGDACLRHGVIVVSDEIHADFVYPGNRHTVFSLLGSEYANNCIICTSPSKTFNIAGLSIAHIIVENAALRERFKARARASGCDGSNIFGMTAAKSLYKIGAPWFDALLKYIEGNIDFMTEFLAERLPSLTFIKPQGTYLVWLDCRSLGLGENELEKLIVEKARLWLDGGGMFGENGVGWQRINVACPRKTLTEALERLESAIKGK